MEKTARMGMQGYAALQLQQQQQQPAQEALLQLPKKQVTMQVLQVHLQMGRQQWLLMTSVTWQLSNKISSSSSSSKAPWVVQPHLTSF
jgi:hypothetical protein